MQKISVENLYDIIGKGFDAREDIFFVHLEQMSNFCDRCFSKSEIKGKTILDAGCGTGAGSIYFSRNGAGQVFSVDLSQGSLEVLQRYVRLGSHSIKFQKADLLSLPFGCEAFDIVFSCGALAYIENIFEVLEELIRVTKRDGKLVLMFLKKTKLDIFFNLLRVILCRVPLPWIKDLARFLSFLSRPIARFFLKRQVRFSKSKPLEQTILEAFFSPVKLNRQYPIHIQSFFEGKGFRACQIKGINGVDFFSPRTAFVIKLTRNG